MAPSRCLNRPTTSNASWLAPARRNSGFSKMWGIRIDLGGTKIEALALSAEGEERNRVRIPTPRGDYGATLDAIVSVARLAGAELKDEEIAGVGIGIPGSLSPKTSLVRNANSTWLNGRPLLRDLEGRLKLPVKIANDANCFAL